MPQIDYSDRQGDWIITFTGKRFYPVDPRAEDINIEDVAHALSLINRFTGHTNYPFSVAQHCLHVSYQVAPGQELAGLLHDASEAYVNDIAAPLKKHLPDYKIIEDRIQDVIDIKFGVRVRTPEVKTADIKALVTEAASLCNGEQWYLEPHWPASAGYLIRDRDWRSVEEEYLERFEQLWINR